MHELSSSNEKTGNDLQNESPESRQPISLRRRLSSSTKLPRLITSPNHEVNYEVNSDSNTTVSTPICEKVTSKDQPVTWLSLPNKLQLFILFLCRLADFFQVASLQAYLFFQLKGFDAGLSDAQISSQAGILQGCFFGAQVATGMLWGQISDSPAAGRKTVLVVGLLGSAISCLGYGFATTFWQAILYRAFAGGINGTVGTIRTMISELVKDKRYQSRAFLILPMSFNVAGIAGPIVGGVLADPSMTLPALFGSKALFGCKWMRTYPYALPGIINAAVLALTAGMVFLGIEETLKARRGQFDYGLHLGKRLRHYIQSRTRFDSSGQYSKLPFNDPSYLQPTYTDPDAESPKPALQPHHILPFHRIFTKNVLFTLLTVAFFDFHMGAFSNLWSLFLSTARTESDSSFPIALPFTFPSGLGLSAPTVGLATSIIGILGIIMQLTLYPPIHARLGTLRSLQYSLLLFPLAYFLAPYLALLSIPAMWPGIVVILFLQVLARTFSLPATIMLINNCSPHPSVLGTVHGLGQSVSAACRTVGPVIAGWAYGVGLERGVVGLGWWATAAVAAVGCVTAFWCREGSGHEVFLPGEERDGLELELKGLLRHDEEEKDATGENRQP